MPVRISVSSCGPITMLSLRRGPVGHLWRVLCSRQRQRCSLQSASCLRELCMVLGQGCWLDSGRTEHLLVPCRLELQCTQAAGPCTYERHCEKNDGEKVNIILQQEGDINTSKTSVCLRTELLWCVRNCSMVRNYCFQFQVQQILDLKCGNQDSISMRKKQKLFRYLRRLCL